MKFPYNAFNNFNLNAPASSYLSYALPPLEFEDSLRHNKIEDTEADIVKINNEIEDLEAKIDASVFKLYELEEEEIKVVFDSLKTPTIYQGKVLEFFRML